MLGTFHGQIEVPNFGYQQDTVLEDPQLCPVYHMVRLNKLKKVIVANGACSDSARDVRSVDSPTAAQVGQDIGGIMQAADLRRVGTFQSHYFKPLFASEA